MSKSKFDAAIEARERQDRLDAFAAAALTGLIAHAGSSGGGDPDEGWLASRAYDYADAMEARRAERLGK